jgi:hypothetical protein
MPLLRAHFVEPWSLNRLGRVSQLVANEEIQIDHTHDDEGVATLPTFRTYLAYYANTVCDVVRGRVLV